MQSILFPIGLLGEPEVWNLSAELKLVLASTACHFNQTACGVIHLSGVVSASLYIEHSVLVHLATELDRRGIAVFDAQTLEFFIVKNFHWHKTPAETGAGSPWARNVLASAGRIRSEKIKKAVFDALAAAPAEKIPAVLVPANLLSSLPLPSTGGAWSCSELLMVLCCYTHKLQNCSGFFVAQLGVIGEFCSIPQKTVLENFLALDAAGGLVFDEKTSELFMPTRLKNSHPRDQKAAAKFGQEIRSRRAKNAFSKQYSRTFGKYLTKSKICAPVDVDVDFDVDVDINTTTVASAPAVGKGGGFDKKVLKELESMLEATGRRLGKDNSATWARRAVERIKKEGMNDAEKQQLENWRKQSANSEKTKAGLQKTEAKIAAIGSVGSELVGKELITKNGTKFTVKHGMTMIAGKMWPMQELADAVQAGDFALVA